MNQSFWDAHFASQNKPCDTSVANIVTRGLEEDVDREDHITPSKVSALFSGQDNHDDHSSATGVTRDSEDKYETKTEDHNNPKAVLKDMKEILAENDTAKVQFSCK